jgi:hypothetical protein
LNGIAPIMTLLPQDNTFQHAIVVVVVAVVAVAVAVVFQPEIQGRTCFTMRSHRTW